MPIRIIGLLILIFFTISILMPQGSAFAQAELGGVLAQNGILRDNKLDQLGYTPEKQDEQGKQKLLTPKQAKLEKLLKRQLELELEFGDLPVVEPAHQAEETTSQLNNENLEQENEKYKIAVLERVNMLLEKKLRLMSEESEYATKQLEDTISEQSHAISQLKAEEASARADEASNIQETDKAEYKISVLEETNALLEEKLKQTLEQSENSKKQLEDTVKEQKEAMKQLLSIQDANAKSGETNKSLEIENAKYKISVLEKTNALLEEKLKLTIKQSEDTANQLNAEIEKFNTQLSDYDDMKAKYKNMDLQKQDLDSANSKLKQLEYIVKDQEKIIKQLRIEEASAKADKVNKDQAMDQAMQNEKYKVAVLEKTNMLLEKKLKLTSEESQNLTKELRAEAEKLRIQLADYGQMKTKYKDFDLKKQSLDSANSKLKQLEDTVKQQNEAINQLKMAEASAKADAMNKSLAVESEKNNNIVLKKNNALLEKKLKLMFKRSADTAKQLEDTAGEHSQIIEQLKTAQENAKAGAISKNLALENEKRNNALLEEKLKLTSKQSEDAINQLKAEIEKFNIQLSDYNKIKTENKGMGILVSKQKSRNSYLQKQNLNLAHGKLKQLEDKIKKQNEAIKQLKSAQDSLKADVTAKNQAIENEKKNAAAWKKNKALLEEKLKLTSKQSENTIKELKAEIEKCHLQLRDYDDMKAKYQGLEALVDKQKGRNINSQKQGDGLIDNVITLEETFSEDRASLYKELGTLYVQVKLYDQAVDAYEKSLAIRPDDAEVNYNIGLLYKQCKKDPKRAAYHLKRFVDLTPDKQKREDVRYLIDIINNGN